MRWSLARFLDAAAPHLDTRLAAPRELARVRSLLDCLPDAISDWIYLECRLCPRDPRIDVIVRVDRAHRDVLAGGRSEHEPATPAFQPAWQRARAFARMWDREAGWDQAIESLWLEFDSDEGSGDTRHGYREPRFFVDLTRLIRTQGSPDEWRRIACDAIAPLSAQVVPREITEALGRSLNALPAGASLLSVGLPSTGATPGLRVCLMGLATSDLPSFLGAVGWEGDARGVSDVVGALLGAASITQKASSAQKIDLVDLDLTPGTPGRLGIELAFARKPQLRGQIEEQHLLAKLVTLGLADAASIEALGAWPGYEIARMPHVFWPELLVRRLNHVKLVFERDRVVAVKAYPCVFHRFTRRIAPRLYSIDSALDIGAPIGA